jgi:hypothetical protein
MVQRLGNGVFSASLGLIPLAVMTVAACASQAQSPVAAPSGGGLCAGDGLGRFVGQNATAQLGADILRQSGASTLRWVPDGTMVTMEFRGERVTVHLDRSNRVERAVCG